MKLSPGDSLGSYRILSSLGAGGMGEVYLAEDTRLNRRVAVKILPDALLEDPDRRARFLREARAAAAVDHPNIVHIYEVVEEPEGRTYLVMQHVEGQTLRQVLAGGKLELEQSLDMAVEISEALSAAHAKRIIHRDIKPDNVMIDPTGHARLLDFGLARAIREPTPEVGASAIETAAQHTSPGVVMGTIAYMSPEQARGDELDARSDIFSFGVTLYEAVTGRYPFAGRTSIEATDALLHREPEPASAIAPSAPPAVDWVLGKMLAKDREERYQTAREVVADLKKIQHSTPGSERTAVAAVGHRRWKVPLAAAIAAGIAVAALVTWLALRALDTPGKSGVAAHAAGPMRLAVLPFHNVREDPRIDFLGFALADAVISKLAYVQSVTVRPSSFVQRYRDAPPDPQQAATELGVDHLLTGSLLAEGSTLRLSVQFVDLAEGAVRWQDTIDANLENLLSLQDEIVDRIVGGMKLRLSPEETSRIERDVSRDSRAYDLTLRALALPQTVDGDQRAIDLLKQAVERDPAFARAWALLADRQYKLGLYGEGHGRLYEEAERSAQRALELNPDLPQALQELAIYLTERGRHEEAYAKVRRWLEVNPSDAEAHFARSYVLRYTGLLEESASEVERALELLPDNPGFRSGGATYGYQGNYDRSDEIVALDEGSSWALAALARTALLRGDVRRARELAERCRATDPGSQHSRFAESLIVALDGDRPAAAAMVRASRPEEAPDPEVLFTNGAYLSWLGDTATALDLLRRAVAGGFYCYPVFLNDPRLENVRGLPEFAPLLEEARRRHEAFRAFVAANP